MCLRKVSSQSIEIAVVSSIELPVVIVLVRVR